MLVEAGRMEPKPIMVITSLEDNDHAQVRAVIQTLKNKKRTQIHVEIHMNLVIV